MYIFKEIASSRYTLTMTEDQTEFTKLYHTYRISCNNYLPKSILRSLVFVE